MSEFDSTKGSAWAETRIPFSRDKLAFGYDPEVTLDLAEWEQGGIRIGFSIGDRFRGFYNDEPYRDRTVAERQYRRVLKQVQKGNYRIEMKEDHQLRLVLTKSK